MTDRVISNRHCGGVTSGTLLPDSSDHFPIRAFVNIGWFISVTWSRPHAKSLLWGSCSFRLKWHCLEELWATVKTIQLVLHFQHRKDSCPLKKGYTMQNKTKNSSERPAYLAWGKLKEKLLGIFLGLKICFWGPSHPGERDSESRFLSWFVARPPLVRKRGKLCSAPLKCILVHPFKPAVQPQN